jgi:hypothetical protein
MSGLGKAWVTGQKSLVDHQQEVKYKDTTIKTLCLACIAISSKDRRIGAYSIGLTIVENSAVQIIITKRRRRISRRTLNSNHFQAFFVWKS